MKKIFIALVGMAIAMPSVFAATWYVSPNGNDGNSGATWALAKKTIQAGVDTAASNDTVLVTNGEYVLSGQIIVSSTIAVRSVNGPIETIVNGNGQNTSNRCFYLEPNCTLDGFTVTNGSLATAHGGGVYCVSTETVITNCVITGNEVSGSWFGGGVSGGTLNNCTLADNLADNGGGTFGSTLNNCMLTGNSASGGGGGASGSTLNNCTLTDNSGNLGGASYNSTLNNCTLTDNSAHYGGGGAYYGTLNNCTLTGNSVISRDPSISNGGGGASGSTLNNCTLTDNSAYNGGGAYYGTLNNCLLIDNSADSSGGGACYGTLNNCTLSRNTAADGSGVFNGGLKNCIVYYNYGMPQCDMCFPSYTCAPDAPAGNGNITNEPMFMDKNNGDYRLSVGSPCIDTGNNQYAPTNVTPVDLYGNSRIFNGTVDMGAYEYGSEPPTPAVVGPVIMANGSTNNITINSTDNLSVTVQFNPGEYAGTNDDWWVVALAGSSWYYLNSAIQWTPFDGYLSNCHPVHQGALFDLPATEALNITGLSTGLYTFWFAVDSMDGIVNLDGPIWLDSVNVLVQ